MTRFRQFFSLTIDAVRRRDWRVAYYYTLRLVKLRRGIY